MDERDARILVELTRTPFDALEAVGRKVGTTGTAVKARLDALAARGVLQGFACGPGGAALGKHARLALYGGGPVDAPLHALAADDEVAWAARAYPASAVVMLYRDDPDAPLPEGLLRAAGRAPDKVVVSRDPRPAGPRATLSPLDWRVMRALLGQPRASAAALARETGLSARVVRERRDRLFASGDLYAFPILDATQEEGVILYNAYVNGGLDALRALRLPNAHRLATHQDPPGAFLVGFVRTFAEAHVVEGRLRAMPGVTGVSFSIPQGTVVARERVRAWVDEQVATWERARRGKPARG